MHPITGAALFDRFMRETKFFRDPEYLKKLKGEVEEKPLKNGTKIITSEHRDQCILCGRDIEIGERVARSGEFGLFTDVLNLKVPQSAYWCHDCVELSSKGRGKTGKNFYVALDGDSLVYQVSWDARWYEVPNIRPMISVINKNKNKHFYYLLKTSEDPRLFIAFLDEAVKKGEKPIRANVTGVIEEGQAFHTEAEKLVSMAMESKMKKNDFHQMLDELSAKHFLVSNHYLADIAVSLESFDFYQQKKELGGKKS